MKNQNSVNSFRISRLEKMVSFSFLFNFCIYFVSSSCLLFKQNVRFSLQRWPSSIYIYGRVDSVIQPGNFHYFKLAQLSLLVLLVGPVLKTDLLMTFVRIHIYVVVSRQLFSDQRIVSHAHTCGLIRKR